MKLFLKLFFFWEGEGDMKEGGGGDSFFILFDDFDPKLIFILPYFFQKEWVKMIFFYKIYTPDFTLFC